MVFSFKYKPIRLIQRTIYRPLIKISFNGNQTFDIFALLDSGSDTTVIPMDFAEALELKFEGKDKLSGITSSLMNVRQSKVLVSFGKGHERYSFEIPVLVPTNKNFNKFVIGRAGFFDEFKITFDESNKRIEFKKINKLRHLLSKR